jgi:hypothetical protein
MDKYNKKKCLVSSSFPHSTWQTTQPSAGAVRHHGREGERGGGPHRCSGADDESGSGELNSSSAGIRGGPGHGVDGKGARSSDSSGFHGGATAARELWWASTCEAAALVWEPR